MAKSVAEVVASSELFRSLTPPQVERIVALTHVGTFPADETVFQAGNELENLYVVQEGSVRLSMAARLQDRGLTLRSIVAVIEVGGTLGWSALVEPKIATLSAHTVEPCKLLAIKGSDLIEVLDDDHHMGYQVMTAMAALISKRLLAISLSLMLERLKEHG